MKQNKNREIVAPSFYRKIEAFVKKRVSQPQDAEELVQEIFLKLKANLSKLEEAEKLNAWLFAIARNQIVDYYRKKGRPVPSEFEDDSQSETGDASSLAAKEVASWLWFFIPLLEPADSEILELIEFKGLTQKQAAEKLGLTLSGTKSRHQRAKKRLRIKMESCCAYELDSRGSVVGYEKKESDCC